MNILKVENNLEQYIKKYRFLHKTGPLALKHYLMQWLWGFFDLGFFCCFGEVFPPGQINLIHPKPSKSETHSFILNSSSFSEAAKAEEEKQQVNKQGNTSLIIFMKEINHVYMSKNNWSGEGRPLSERPFRKDKEAAQHHRGKRISTHRNGKCASHVFGAHTGWELCSVKWVNTWATNKPRRGAWILLLSTKGSHWMFFRKGITKADLCS